MDGRVQVHTCIYSHCINNHEDKQRKNGVKNENKNQTDGPRGRGTIKEKKTEILASNPAGQKKQ